MHKKFTGVDNRLILANARTAAQDAVLWVRVPLIRGFNDHPDHIRALAKLALAIGAKKLSLLPYHEGGQSRALKRTLAIRF